MIINPKHVGCLALTTPRFAWIRRVATHMTRVLAEEPEQARQGNFFVFAVTPPKKDEGDLAALKYYLAAMCLASGWPAVTLNEQYFEDEGPIIVFISLHRLAPNEAPNAQTYTPVTGDEAALCLDSTRAECQMYRGQELVKFANPHYQKP
jgi:hypothetical protein